ncbi:D-cysteate sulfo-lyase [Pelosinus propionicus]|uniref:D-cysteine desulfhydrase n=1 Tax=Pelosinus propionicus DSM 13327 TaxID=1123291 RepID=A0A1I4LF64_9FIRM|nr:D-cysteine desulfhydrase [Pelosinus propionicus]SFL89486.1 D-cysteine desulfhydrase [Pelosinus propionicus DSM 13327]
MYLAQYPRRQYTEGYTPIEKLERLTAAVGGANIYIKRDDLLGLTGGGNKTRKLEFLVADALRQGADTLITCGGIQSNHCRLTLAAAVKEGLKCRLIVSEITPGSYHIGAGGNVFLYHLLGAEDIKVIPWGSDIIAEMEQTAAKAIEEGCKPYIIPMGGSNALGALGYVACAEEIMQQAFFMGMPIDHIVVACGSAGTYSGLLFGLRGNNCHIPVSGISVLNSQEVLQNRIIDIFTEIADYLNSNVQIPSEAVTCFDEYLGDGYTIPTAAMIEAVKLVARTEGILLDPTYTGKAMAGLIDLIKKGYFKKDANVLFLHTGGSPGLYANMSLFL